MKSIALLFWRICIFRSGPDTIPVNNILTIAVIAVNALLSIAVQLTYADPAITALSAVTLAVVSLAGTGGLIWFVMALMNLTNRVAQTVTAVFGVDIILTTITAVAFALAGAIDDSVRFFAVTLLTLWSLAIYGFIFHRAMNIHIGFGIAIALFVVIFSVAITEAALST
jgi:hypothetical protein